MKITAIETHVCHARMRNGIFGNDPLITRAFFGEIGVARVDITPPAGINARNWGAAVHDIAEGVHRPLTATVLALSPARALAATESPPLLLIAADLGWWKSLADEQQVRGAVLTATGLPPSHVLLSLSHTHAGPNLYREDATKPGGELIAPYLDALGARLAAAARTALAARRPARLSWRYGRCSLAQNRDLPHPTEPRYLVGWNPGEPADDTLLVGRVEDADSGRLLATVVNYACHPTTLAAGNRLISPDFPGALRELVEDATASPCLFLQGASGELGTAAQHGHDPAVADRLGRQLGHAVLGTLESWPDALHAVARIVESGAPLALTELRRPRDTAFLAVRHETVALPLKPLESMAALEQALATCEDRALRERLWRKRAVRRIVGDGTTAAMPLWCWRVGEALLVAQPNEAYSLYQRELRRRFAPRALAVLNVTNGYAGYLPPADQYQRNQYSVWQTPFAAGSLEHLVGQTAGILEALVSPGHDP